MLSEDCDGPLYGGNLDVVPARDKSCVLKIVYFGIEGLAGCVNGRRVEHVVGTAGDFQLECWTFGVMGVVELAPGLDKWQGIASYGRRQVAGGSGGILEYCRSKEASMKMQRRGKRRKIWAATVDSADRTKRYWARLM
jgi:hypothetical protein